MSGSTTEGARLRSDLDDVIERQREFGCFVAGRRRAAGLSVDELAQRLGCQPTSVERVEQGCVDSTVALLISVVSATALDGEDVMFAAYMD